MRAGSPASGICFAIARAPRPSNCRRADVLILYEYPLNERVRTLLRLEDLFERLDFFTAGEHAFQHHVALTTLFDILDIAARADLKSDLLQELERQRQALMGFQVGAGRVHRTRWKRCWSSSTALPPSSTRPRARPGSTSGTTSG
jgi:hypothetical protein